MNKIAHEKVKELNKLWCIECEKSHGKKDVDKCFTCPIHKLFNEIYEELNR